MISAAGLSGIARRTSRRLTMRDGVGLAADVWLPRHVGQPMPAILLQTRYMRSIRWSPVARAAGLDALLDIHGSTRRRLLEAGYAWVDVDARGSGASEGSRPSPWHREEVRDGVEVVDWIVRQPWSDGSVGSTGVSYAGTAAEMLLAERHPALRAIAPRFSLFDVYADVAFPGGLHSAWFTETWARFNWLLDANRYPDAVGLMARINVAALAGRLREERDAIAQAARACDAPWLERVVSASIAALAGGVRACEDDEDPIACLERAVAAHANNADVHAMALEIEHRDDAGLSEAEPEASIDSFSPHVRVADVAASGAAVLGVSGWLDGAYQHSAIKRHLSLPADRSWLLVGPWDHGGRQNVSPFDPAYAADFDHDGELVAFFDAQLRGRGEWDRPRVRWYAMGEERWKSADRWPPPGVEPRTWFLAPGGALAREAPADGGADAYALDADIGSGPSSRWRSLLGLAAPVGYADRRALGPRMRVWESAELEAPLDVAGHPIAHLWIAAAGASDVAVFVYLEDVGPGGRVAYVTEGELRACHRRFRGTHETGAPRRTFTRADAEPLSAGAPAELVVDLLPVSWRFAAGHRLRVSLACADADHFRAVPDAPRRIDVLRGGAHASRVVLPVV
jgi:hypothetical protein